MKRAILALLATVAGLVFIFSFRPASVTSEPATIIAAPAIPKQDVKNQKQKPKLDGKGIVDYDLAGQGLDVAGLADGTYLGAAVEIPGGHGLVQVSVTIAGGEVVDIETAHQPTSAHSVQVSGQALPLLREEVLTTQQVPVDAISGATAVSQAFGESLLSVAGAP
jgi:uncharacterized protein with FMN-binding domain